MISPGGLRPSLRFDTFQLLPTGVDVRLFWVNFEAKDQMGRLIWDGDRVFRAPAKTLTAMIAWRQDIVESLPEGARVSIISVIDLEGE